MCFSQDNNEKSQKVSFTVKGVCKMCKDRIEKGTIKIKGIKYVTWDIMSNNVSLIYNSKKISLDEIHKGISLLGHSTNKYTAPSEIYNNLPDCCMYETLEKH